MRSLSFLFVLTAFNFSQAATKIITTCSGFVSPDNMAVSIKLISDPENDGSTTKAEVHTYLDGQYLGPLECEGNTPMTSPIACHTKYGETYIFDLNTMSAEQFTPNYGVTEHPNCQ